MILVAVLLIVLAPLAIAALLVDDWARDLNTNRAATSADATDPRLLPLSLEADEAQVCAAIEQFAEANNAWGVVESRDATVRLVRTSRLMRFRDDVQVTLFATEGGGCRVEVSSASRIGKGDLGQNPRNINELLEGLRGLFDASR